MYGKLIHTNWTNSSGEDGHYIFEFERALIEIVYYSKGVYSSLCKIKQEYFDIDDVQVWEQNGIELITDYDTKEVRKLISNLM